MKTMPLMEALSSLELPDLQRNLFSSPDWQRVIHATYGLKQFCKYIEEEGRITSYFIYSVVHNFLEWKICVGSYCDYLDCHVSKPQHWHMFFEAIRREYPRYRIAIRNLKDESARQCSDFTLLSKEMHHEIDVRDDLEVLWQNAHRTFKVAYKRALASGLKFRRCNKADLPRFYQLHLRLRKNKYRIFPQPYRFFDNIWRQYIETDQGVLFGAFDKRQAMVAAQIYLVCGDTLYYKFSTSQPQALTLKPNNLLMWEGIKFAKERHLQTIDLGSSDESQEGLIWFKTHICKTTREHAIHHIGYAPKDYKYSRKRILKAYTKFFTMRCMPDFMVGFGSNFIYPFLA
jgi:lipid II:glycine glycyltransferase (peptidoglycan interpeptide bridge formation enzyme)